MAKEVRKTPKQVESKRLIDQVNMRNRALSKGEVMLMRVGLAVIVITVAIILGIVLLNSFNQDEVVENPLEDYIALTEIELNALVGYDSESDIYGNFSFFSNTEDEVYQEIDTLLKDTTVTEIHILFYRASLLDETLESRLIELKDTLSTSAFFLVDLENSANQAIFQNQTLLNAGLNQNVDEQLLTFFIEGKEENSEVIYFELWTRVSDILISINKI